MGTPVDRKIVFTAAGTQPVALEGRFVRVLEADATGVTIKTEPGSPLLRYAGQDIDAGQTFKRLLVSVTVASTVRLCVSDTRQADNQENLNANVSATVGAAGTLPTGGDVACAAGVSTPLWAGSANALTVIVRSSAANNYPAGSVRVGGTGVGAAQGIELNPGETLELATTAAIAAWNANAAAVTLQVLPVEK